MYVCIYIYIYIYLSISLSLSVSEWDCDDTERGLQAKATVAHAILKSQ